jgi:hypothetical protein
MYSDDLFTYSCECFEVRVEKATIQRVIPCLTPWLDKIYIHERREKLHSNLVRLLSLFMEREKAWAWQLCTFTNCTPHSRAALLFACSYRPFTYTPVPILQAHPLQLHIIIQQPNLIPRLKSRQSNIRTAVASECIAQRTVPARAHFALYCEIYFRKIIRGQLSQISISIGALSLVFSFQSLRETAGAIFAGSPALGCGFACIGCGL